MRNILLCGVTMLALAACGGPARDPETDPNIVPAVPLATEPGGAALHVLDIGDVEAQVRIAGTLKEEAQTAGVEVNEFTTPKGDLNMTTVTLHPPYPRELPVRFRVVARQDFKTRPVALKGALFRNDAQLTEVSGVLTGRAGAPVFDIDALQGIDTPPDSLLLHVRLNALLLPEGTDPTTVDPGALEYPPDHTAHLISNPVRINFSQEGSP